MHDHANQHARVLSPAILRAVAQVCSWRHGFYPHAVVAVWNDIGFSGELWDPEAVRDIGRFQFKKRRSRLSRVAHRNMQFVRGHDAKVGIADLPPPLVTADCDFQCFRRRDGVLNFGNRAGGDQGQHKHDNDRYDSPCELDLIAAVDLRWFLPVVFAAMSESRDRINKQADDYHENHSADSKHDNRVVKYSPSRRTSRFEYVGHAARSIGEGRTC